jgi:hypothetical protein
MAISSLSEDDAAEIRRALGTGKKPFATAGALTAADAGAIDSGDSTTDDVITANRTRIGEIETVLQALGLLT